MKKQEIVQKKISVLPSTLEKRELLYGKGSDPANLRKIGESYLEAGQADEAAGFFQMAKELSGLEKMAGEAMTEGDYFTFCRIMEMLGRKASPEEWKRLAEEARKRGKELFALKAEKAAQRDGPDR